MLYSVVGSVNSNSVPGSLFYVIYVVKMTVFNVVIDSHGFVTCSHLRSSLYLLFFLSDSYTCFCQQTCGICFIHYVYACCSVAYTFCLIFFFHFRLYIVAGHCSQVM